MSRWAAGPSEEALRAASGRQMVVIADAPTGTAATDRAMLVQAIADTPVGGLLLLPGAADGTFYAIDQALVVAKQMTIEGASMAERWKGRTAGGSLNRPSDPYLGGAVIKQVTAATDVLQLTGAAASVNLRDLGLTFASAIKDTNTGHGINAAATAVPSGGGHDSGPMAFHWRNLAVVGHDGNHYAYRLLNPILGTLESLRGYGGGGLSVECDSYEGNYGNLVVEHFYTDLSNAGTANGVQLTARVAAPDASGVLNLMTFIRPQINITGAAATAGTQHLWKSPTVYSPGIDVIDPDLESAGGNPINFGGINSGTMVRNGGLMNGNPTGGYDRGPGACYQKFTASGSFKVPNGVTKVRVRAIGGGGGGGGGGSALTSGGVTQQAGGGGGGAGLVADAVIDVTPDASYTITVGAGGTAGTSAAANGNAGGSGGNGGRSSFQSLVRADGGAGGAGALGNSATSAAGGMFGRVGSTTTSTDGIPGHGGPGRGTATGLTATPMPPGVVGGGGGGGASATLGGGRGSASQFAFPAYTAMGGGGVAASTDANGVAGQAPAADAYGCGGAGGGGGAPGGTGGAGSAGVAGAVEVWW